jgi:hypothetical protein
MHGLRLSTFSSRMISGGPAPKLLHEAQQNADLIYSGSARKERTLPRTSH